jgi:hypothetical protein
MKDRMIPRAHAREIAELCVDISDKAHYWKQRAKVAEAKLASLPTPALLEQRDKA